MRSSAWCVCVCVQLSCTGLAWSLETQSRSSIICTGSFWRPRRWPTLGSRGVWSYKVTTSSLSDVSDVDQDKKRSPGSLQPCWRTRGGATASRQRSPPNRSSSCRVSAFSPPGSSAGSPESHALSLSRSFCPCSAQLGKLQADMEALREQRESTICTTREELYSAQEEVSPFSPLI